MKFQSISAALGILALAVVGAVPVRAATPITITVGSATVLPGGFGSLDVTIANSGPSAQNIAGFAFEISAPAGSGITFTGATTSTALTYIFNGDSFFGPNINTNTGSTIDAADISQSGTGTNLASGTTVGIAHVTFTVAAGATLPATVTLSINPVLTNLSDSGGNTVNFAGVNGSITTSLTCISPNTVTGTLGANVPVNTSGCLTVGGFVSGNNANENLTTDGLFVNPTTNTGTGVTRGFQSGQLSVSWQVTQIGSGVYQYTYTFTNVNTSNMIAHIILGLGGSSCITATTDNNSGDCIYNLITDAANTTGINKGANPCPTPYSCNASDGATGFFDAANPISGDSGTGTSNPQLPSGFATTAFQLEPVMQAANTTGSFTLQFNSVAAPVWENIYIRDDISQNDTTSVESWNNSVGSFYVPAPGTFIPPPSISKSFGASSIPLNGNTTLSFTITNPNASTAVTGVSFTDTLPAGLVVSTPNGLTPTTCNGTSITATGGSNTISLANATLGAGGSCTFSVSVTGISGGKQDNSVTIFGGTNSSEMGNTSTASVIVVKPPGITKTFGAPTIPLNGTTTLNFAITNPNPTNGNAAYVLNNISFTDNLPAGLVVASTPGLSGGCDSGTITATAGATSVSLSGASRSPSAICNFTVNVTGTTAGLKPNSVQVSSDNGGTGNTSNASVTVSQGSTTTTAANATATFSASDQPVTLSATVTSPQGTVNEGTVTFAVFQGATQIGSSVVSGTVSSNAASASYSLPGNTPPGTYTIQATYNPGADFTGGSDNTHTLTVNCTTGTAPMVTQNPQSLFLHAGDTATFTAAATGIPAPTVQWQVSTDGGATWTDIPSANTTTLSFAVDASMNGNHYRAVFSNTCGAVATDPTITLTVPAPDTLQIRYTSNLNLGDSYINLTNDGRTGTYLNGTVSATNGNLCVGVYFFDPNEEMQACCACEVTPNGLISLSVKDNNLNNLTQGLPNSEVVKLLTWSATSSSATTTAPGSPINPTPGASICNAANPGAVLSGGMHAWGTTLHALPAPATGFAVTETEFSRTTLVINELNRISSQCAFAQQAGSVNFGQCRGCQSGGLGAAASQ